MGLFSFMDKGPKVEAGARGVDFGKRGIVFLLESGSLRDRLSRAGNVGERGEKFLVIRLKDFSIGFGVANVARAKAGSSDLFFKEGAKGDG